MHVSLFPTKMKYLKDFPANQHLDFSLLVTYRCESHKGVVYKHCWEQGEASLGSTDQVSLCEVHQATSDRKLLCSIASNISFAKKQKRKVSK